MDIKELKDLIKTIKQYDIAEFRLKEEKFELTIRSDKYSSTKTIRNTSPTQSPVVISTPPAVAPVAAPVVNPAQAAATAAVPPMESIPKSDEDAADVSNANLVEIKSPIVGTFYRSSSPDKPPFIKVGDTVNEGDVVCIIEAMKLFNEIESEVSGKIVKVLTEDASPVEYDRVLFLVDPNG